jgi:DNA-binding NarL/FixJ family response regulator
MSETPYEPYVFIDRSPAPPTTSARRWTALRGRKPALLLIDRDGTGLDHPLASEGFDVYRTTGRDSALDLLRAHPSVLMALVRAGLPGLDAPELIRELHDAQPGLWVGVLCDPDDRPAAEAAYAAGAEDLFHRDADPVAIVARLVRAAPRALRLREQADRRQNRVPGPSRLRRLARRVSARMGLAATILLGLGLGAATAAATQSWHEARDLWNARLERFMSAMESSRPPSDRVDRQFDRWQRLEQLNLQLQSQRAQQDHFRDQRDEDLFRKLPSPQYVR